ncbi:Scytalone dehydratase-like Arp1-like protein [Cladobotryum mycophilum]|uniref:Scytalone dehydratase-like Arp1-like protein n=1 Tax=Cladobotryum mycophilum TaxID=491253 RepID=A0ABR0SQJ0_9HYPO
MKNLFTVVLAGTQYLLHPQKLGTIEQTINPDALIPVTLLSTSELNGDLEGILQLFETVDDVYSDEFTGVLVEKPDTATNGSFTARGKNPKTGIYANYTMNMPKQNEFRAMAFDGLPSGPYFLHGPNLYQAWRLYDDDLDAFTFGVLPESINGTSDEWEALSSLSDNAVHKSIAVPSRLYHPAPSIRKPLSGVRMSITDAVSLKGVQTTMSSRSWTELYDTGAEETADYAQTLIDLGAIIIGKTKSSQFDSGREWVDKQAPWNPRGDRYQSPEWSAAGAAAALSGYDWMQYSTAQDALEGVREQGNVHGLYALRSTKDQVSLSDWQVSSPRYDSAGLLSRDLDELLTLAQVSLNMTNADVALPKRIVYPLDFYPIRSRDHQKLDDKFVAALEKLLGVKAERVSMSALWLIKPPVESIGQTLEHFIGEAPFDTFCYEFYHEYDDFRKACRAKLGNDPYVEATPRFRWNIGEKETKEQYDAYLKRIEVFKKWFSNNIMSTVAGSDTVMVLPFGDDQQRYRDEAPRKPTAIQGITSELLAPLLETPQFVVPFAQISYKSKVTGLTEYRPVTGSVMGPKGGDVMLVELVKKAFEQAKWHTYVGVGRLTFPEIYQPN